MLEPHYNYLNSDRCDLE